jgi:hypothetical protein
MKPPLPTQLPILDPDKVAEVYSNDFILQVRQSGVQLTFCSVRAASSDAAGVVSDERVVVARLAMPISLLSSMFEVCRQLGIVLQQQQQLASVPTDVKPN